MSYTGLRCTLGQARRANSAAGFEVLNLIHKKPTERPALFDERQTEDGQQLEVHIEPLRVRQVARLWQ